MSVRRILLAAAAAAAVCAAPAIAQETENLRIIDEATSYTVQTPNGAIEITRQMTSCAKNKGWLQPMVPVEGVTPVGEIEVLEALNDPEVAVVDMRTIEWYLEATIPTATHIPYTEVAERLDELGCVKNAEGAEPRWNCETAMRMIAFCNGPVCPQSPTAIKAMDREGYPMDRVMYYRGGMLDWDALGFTTVEGEM